MPKGLLRIAIEDFITSNPVGKWLYSWYVQWGEHIEDDIFNHYRDVIDTYNNTPNMPESLKLKGSGTPDNPHQAGIAQGLGTLFGIGQTAAGSMIGPFMKQTEFIAQHKWPTMRFDPSMAFALMRRDPSKAFLATADMLDLGWSAERIQALALLMEPKLAESGYIQYWLRGLITEQALDDELTRRGYTAPSIAMFKELSKQIPGVQDLISLAVRDAWNDSAAAKFGYDEEYPAEVGTWTAKQGLPPEWAKRYWRAHWNLPSPQQGYEMFHRLRPGESANPFTLSDLNTLLKIADYPAYFRQRMVDIAYAPVTRVDLRRLYGQGILNRDQVKAGYKDLGYDEQRAEWLTDFTVKYEDEQGNSKLQDYKDLTQSLLEQSYLKNVINESEYRERLLALKYQDDAIDILVHLADLKRSVAKVPDYAGQYQVDLKNMIQNAYAARLITYNDAVKTLTDASFKQSDAEYILKSADFEYNQSIRNDTIKAIGECYTTQIYDRTQAITSLGMLNLTGTEQTQLLSEWDNAVTYRNKRLSPSEYKQALARNIITLDEYKRCLIGLGYDDYDISILLALTNSGLSVADYKQALRMGVIDQKSFHDSLLKLGYNEGAITILMATDVTTLTYAQYKAAFQQELITEEQLRTGLKDLGYETADIEILVSMAGGNQSKPEPTKGE